MDLFFQPDLGRDYEAEELEEIENAQQEELPLPSWVWAPSNGPAPIDADTLLIGATTAGSLFLHANFENIAPVGAITLSDTALDDKAFKESSPQKNVGTVGRSLNWHVNSSFSRPITVMYCISTPRGPADAACDLPVRSPFGISCPLGPNPIQERLIQKVGEPHGFIRTIIFGSMTNNEWRSATEDTAPPLLRKLQTSAASNADKVPLLESPSMITGLAAALLTEREITHQSAHLYMSLLEMQFGRNDVTAQTLQAFEQILPALAIPGTGVKTSSLAVYSRLAEEFRKKDTSHLYL
ncbi:hypothetical protein BC832DRAFT_539205 [Gaertneriomyces semiglobifer]|nr:hypothetical protein BC832DRAFT_539205 [Gaertneriomyces semiglobifer]